MRKKVLKLVLVLLARRRQLHLRGVLPAQSRRARLKPPFPSGGRGFPLSRHAVLARRQASPARAVIRPRHPMRAGPARPSMQPGHSDVVLRWLAPQYKRRCPCAPRVADQCALSSQANPRLPRATG